MNKTLAEWRIEEGIEKGIEKGIEQERRAAAMELLEERFGPLSPMNQQKLFQMPPDQLLAIRRAILRAQSLRELGLDE